MHSRLMASCRDEFMYNIHGREGWSGWVVNAYFFQATPWCLMNPRDWGKAFDACSQASKVWKTSGKPESSTSLKTLWHIFQKIFIYIRIHMCGIYTPPGNNGKWRFSSGPPTEHTIILVLTVPGRGVGRNVPAYVIVWKTDLYTPTRTGISMYSSYIHVKPNIFKTPNH